MVPDNPLELIMTQAVEPGQKKCKPIAGETPCANTLEDYPDDVRLANADCKCITQLFSLLKTIPKAWGSSETTNSTAFACP